ncbi:MAG: glycosyltransferase family 2 protein [Candidatus Heimdallarchaeaceae archaeon]
MIIGNPLVSILLTSYNNPMVEGAIKGVLGQTYKNFELILLDDNSNKKTLDIYKKFNDPRIVFYNSHIKKKDRLKECPYARQINKGLEMAKGKLVMYLTDDNVYYPNKLERVVRYFRWHPRVRVAYNRQRQELASNHILEGTRLTGVSADKIFKILFPDRVLKSAFCRVDHNSVTHYMSCVKEVGNWGTESFAMADAYYWNKLSTKYLFYPIREILEINYFHDDSFSQKIVTGKIKKHE